jgi:predicted transcriptional regulator
MPKVLSIRVSEALYQQAKAIAAERDRSINSLVNEALEHIVTENERESLYNAYTDVGRRYSSRTGHTLPLQRKMMIERQVRSEGQGKDGG